VKFLFAARAPPWQAPAFPFPREERGKAGMGVETQGHGGRHKFARIVQWQRRERIRVSPSGQRAKCARSAPAQRG